MKEGKIDEVYVLNDKIDLANNGQLYRIDLYADDQGNQAGCGSDIGVSYLYIVEKERRTGTPDNSDIPPTEPTTPLGQALKDFTTQKYWDLTDYSFVKIGGRNYLKTEAKTASYKPRFDIPSKSLYEFSPDGKINPVCAFEAESKIVINE